MSKLHELVLEAKRLRSWGLKEVLLLAVCHGCHELLELLGLELHLGDSGWRGWLRD